MYPKFFFERFWMGDQKNELFVCMPFHDSFDKKFINVIGPSAEYAGFDKAERVKEDWEANVITDRIFDGIANSKLLLFDLTDDPKSPCQFSKQVNGNVLYELGIATAIREPEDLVLIRERSSVKVPFDISGININKYKGELTIDWLSNKLIKALKDQAWYTSKRVEAAAKSIDEIALHIMSTIGCRPQGMNHFNISGLPAEVKISILRLVDLGILWFASGIDMHGIEHAYHWTPFGCEVMKHLGIKLLTEKEFKSSAGYKDFLKARKEYLKKKKASMSR
jgi:hypothetical protein